MLKKKITYLGVILFFIVVLAFGAYKLMNARDYQLFGKIISHIDTTEKVVALKGKKIVNAGHQIGNHTYSHKRMVFKSPTFYQFRLGVIASGF